MILKRALSWKLVVHLWGVWWIDPILTKPWLLVFICYGWYFHPDVPSFVLLLFAHLTQCSLCHAQGLHRKWVGKAAKVQTQHLKTFTKLNQLTKSTIKDWQKVWFLGITTEINSKQCTLLRLYVFIWCKLAFCCLLSGVSVENQTSNNQVSWREELQASPQHTGEESLMLVQSTQHCFVFWHSSPLICWFLSDQLFCCQPITFCCWWWQCGPPSDRTVHTGGESGSRACSRARVSTFSPTQIWACCRFEAFCLRELWADVDWALRHPCWPTGLCWGLCLSFFFILLCLGLVSKLIYSIIKNIYFF